VSPILATTAPQELSSFPRSSAWVRRTSTAPILNSGILKGTTVPLSVEIVDRRAVKASSLSLERDIEVGRETSIYLLGPDMAAYANGWLLKVDLVASLKLQLSEVERVGQHHGLARGSDVDVDVNLFLFMINSTNIILLSSVFCNF